LADTIGVDVKLADYLINRLEEFGINEVFQVYGAATGHLVDAFVRAKDIRYVALFHEQACGFAAEGYSKVNGNFGVAMATSGPGGQNLITSAGNCYYDSVPCMFITGQIKQQFMRPDKDIRQVGFQESDQVGCFEPVTKYSVMITKPEDIRYELEKAIHIMKSGRPGPVHLDVPIDIAKAEINPEELIGYDASISKEYYNTSLIETQIDQFIEDLKKSERPVLMIGGGVRLSGAEKTVLELGDLLKIPVFPTWNALDIICSDYEYYAGRIGTYGGPGRNFGIQNSDLLLAIGSRISGRITGGNVRSFARGAKKYVVDVDKAGLQRKLQQVPFESCIYSDAGLFIGLLKEKLIEQKDLPSFEKWTNRCMHWKSKYDTVTKDMFDKGEHVHPYAFMRILSDEMKKDDILVSDCGGNVVVTNHSFKTKTGQRYFTNNGNSPMGFSFAGAIGAWFACDKEKQNVVCVIGDGGMNMNIQELQSLINYNINIKVIILNNHIYGITKAFQETNFEGRMEACGPTGYNPPDFISVSKAYNLETMIIDGTDYDIIRGQIRDILDHEGPLVVDVNCHEYHTYEPKLIGWETPIEDMYPYLPREEFVNNMDIEPLDISLHPERLVYPTTSNKDTME
jgi:acetolactate synthase-1/2/3 large subunit